jgi:hypothetical protein
MKDKSSTLYILFILLGISVAIVGIFLGCDQNKQVNPPVLGPAAGSGPVGGGETQNVTILNEPVTLYLQENEASTLDIVALIENNIGQPMPDGTPVYWTVKGHDSTTATSSNGSSTYTWNIDKIFDGCTYITAQSGDASDTVRMCVARVKATPTPSKVFIVTTNQSIIVWNGTATITATAKTDGIPDEGLEVQFTINGPGTLDASAGETDDSGIATVTLTGNNTSTTNQQTITVTATTSDGRSGSVQIIAQPHP